MEGEPVEVARLAPGEVAEHQIDAFISRRARDNPDRDREEMYMESVRRYNATRREQALWERLRHHEAMARSHTVTLAGLIEGHEQEASRCRVALGLTKLEDESKGAA